MDNVPSISSTTTPRLVFECGESIFYYIILIFYRSDKKEKTKKRNRHMIIALIILGVCLGLGIVATAIAVPIHLLITKSSTSLPSTTTAGKQ
jgi:heme A synthase